MLTFPPRTKFLTRHLKSGKEAFTFLEVLASIAILAILATILITLSPKIRDRFEAARCANNMRQLHVAFSAYIDANNHWPQEPEELWNKPPRDYGEWWINELKPYLDDTNVWKCPAVTRATREMSDQKRPVIHYTPTMFDENRQTPFKWPGQPWFIEIGDMHGHGALICLPDGSVRSLNDLIGSSRR